MNERSKYLRREIIKLSQPNMGYHYGGSFSAVEILISLFDHALKADDKFIMSKGHACWGYYVLLKEKGYSPLLEGHPHLDESNGVNYTSGSMGHGFPAAVGMALARKIQSKPGKIIVLIGDGECQEGTTWESLLIASRYHLDNLIVMVDNNNIQGSGYVSEILPVMEALKAAALSVSWEVKTEDGHNIDALIRSVQEEQRLPKLIICKTIKGKGVSFMENAPAWHAKFLDPVHEAKAIEELS
jgi:transketolase